MATPVIKFKKTRVGQILKILEYQTYIKIKQLLSCCESCIHFLTDNCPRTLPGVINQDIIPEIQTEIIPQVHKSLILKR